MAPVRALRILLALLLLSAQHVALSHQIWHLGDHGLPPTEEQLCDQHEALGTVAGALDSTVVPLVAAAAPLVDSFVAEMPAASRPGLAPSSRGPPSFL